MADHLGVNGARNKVPAGFQCIDLSNPDVNQSIASIKQAGLDKGIFYVINHGIREEVLDELFAEAKKFFGLPSDEKMKLLCNKNLRGYLPPADPKDDRESYSMGVKIPEDDPDPAKLFYGPNLWPPADTLPGWKEAMQRYHREALNVARAVAKIMALALNIEDDFFTQPQMLGEATGSFCHILHYGVQNTDASKEKLGAGPHYDVNLFTLLTADDVSGLQICKDTNTKPQIWETVPPLKGAFVVIIGTILERLSNSLFRPPLHRVLFRQERFSTALHLLPNHDLDIECLATCKSQENPPKYPRMKCGDIVSSRITGDPVEYAQTYTAKA